MTITRECDVCEATGSIALGEDSSHVERYSLQHKPRVGEEDIGPPSSSLSMGGLDMCQRCWVNIAEARTKNYIRYIEECDICHGPDPLRLTLKQSIREGLKVHDRGRGSIALCRGCWTTRGLPNMRRKVNKQTDPALIFELNACRVSS